MVKPTTKSNKKKWLLGGLLVFLIIIIGFATWLFHVGSSDEIISVANQFKTDPSWQLVDNRIQPPSNMCIGDVTCPSISKRWKTQSLTTHDQLSALLHEAGWDFSIKDECTINDPSYTGEFISACSASGIINGYTVGLLVSGSSPQENSWISLSVEKKS